MSVEILIAAGLALVAGLVVGACLVLWILGRRIQRERAAATAAADGDFTLEFTLGPPQVIRPPVVPGREGADT